jgi:hypothetical protein
MLLVVVGVVVYEVLCTIMSITNLNFRVFSAFLYNMGVRRSGLSLFKYFYFSGRCKEFSGAKQKKKKHRQGYRTARTIEINLF